MGFRGRPSPKADRGAAAREGMVHIHAFGCPVGDRRHHPVTAWMHEESWAGVARRGARRHCSRPSATERCCASPVGVDDTSAIFADQTPWLHG